MLSGAWALWRLCVSDFYQGKPIRPDRGMMILDHHHSGDNAPTNPTTPSSIRQPKTPSHAPPFPCSLWLPYPLTLTPHAIPSFFLSSPPFLPRLSVALTVFHNIPSNQSLFSLFYIFMSIILPLLTFLLLSLPLSLSLMANTQTNSALFLAHETFNISFQILADASKKWPNESYLLSTLSAITS